MPADGGAPTTEVRLYQRTEIDPWPKNPRTGKLDVSDILATLMDGQKRIPGRGITEPLRLRREASGRLTALKGARRLMAAAIAGIDELPGIEVTWTDEQALEEALVDEARKALTPLEEARALAQLRDRGMPADKIAARAGRDARKVRQRLKLLDLVPAGIDLLGQGRIDDRLALDLAGLVPEAQERAALKLRAIPVEPGEPIGRRVGGFAVRAERLALDHAPFPLDAELPGGPCTRCPKHTAAQADLFSDVVTEGDECTDKACFERKVTEHNRRSLPLAPPGEAERTPEELDETPGGPPDSGLPPRNAKPEKPLPSTKPKGSAADDAKIERQAEDAARGKALAAISKAFAKKKPDEKLWRLLASFVVRTCSAIYDHELVEALDRRGLGGVATRDARKRLLAQMGSASIGECAGLMAELLAAVDDTGNEDDVFILACRAAKVDHPALLAEELEKARAVAKPAEKPKAKGAKKTTNAGPVIGAEERATLVGQILDLLEEGPMGEDEVWDALAPGGDTMQRRKLSALLDELSRAEELAEDEPGVYGLPAGKSKLEAMTAEQLRDALTKLGGAPTSTTNKEFLIWKVREARREARRGRAEEGAAPRPPVTVGEPDAAMTSRTAEVVVEALETVQLAGDARKEAEARACPKCSANPGKPCLSPKGKLGTGWFHVERASAPPPAPACPLTEAHVAALAKELDLDIHPGASSPLNVWGCAERLLAHLHQQPEIDVARAKLLEVPRFADSGTDNLDLAALYLFKTGAVVRKGARGGWALRVVPGVKAVAPPVDDPAGLNADQRQVLTLLAEDVPWSDIDKRLGWPKARTNAVVESIPAPYLDDELDITDEGRAVVGKATRPPERPERPAPPPAKDPPPRPVARRCAVCGCTDKAACQDDHPESEQGECTWEHLGAADVCSVCLRACQATLKICWTAHGRSAVETALTKKQKGPQPPETFDKTRAKAAIAHLEASGALVTREGKLVAAQPAGAS